MNEQQITQDRQERVTKAKAEIEVILGKYQLALTAEDMIGEHTKVHVEIQFMDLKKHDTPVAQQVDPILDDILNSPNDPIGPVSKKK